MAYEVIEADDMNLGIIGLGSNIEIPKGIEGKGGSTVVYVAQMIRKQSASKAISILQFSKRRISNDVEKALRSAIANAENNHGLDIDSLIVSEAYVGKNLVMKRFRARARGRGAKILKPFSELTIVVREVEEVSADNNSEAA